MLNHIQQVFEDHQRSFEQLRSLFPSIELVSTAMIEHFKAGATLFLFGNGGSAADAQHIAAELIGCFTRERHALPAIALTTDSSVLTSLSNDYHYDIIFKRQLEALLKPNDIVMAISTSGNSANVIKGVTYAKEKQALTIGLTGATGGQLKQSTHHCLCAPSTNTARIQEIHIFMGHLLVELIESIIVQVV